MQRRKPFELNNRRLGITQYYDAYTTPGYMRVLTEHHGKLKGMTIYNTTTGGMKTWRNVLLGCS